MAAMNLNTIYAVKELEHGLIGFSREYEKLVKNNLANNSKIEADCVRRITALIIMYVKNEQGA